MMAEILKELRNWEHEIDDIILYAEELRLVIKAAMLRIYKAGLRLHKVKCIFEAMEVQFTGEGIRPTFSAIDQLKNEHLFWA